MREKAKALLHVVAVYLIAVFTNSFSMVALRLHMSVAAGSFLYNCLNIWSVFTAVYLYAKYVMRLSLPEVYCKKPLLLRRWGVAAALLPAAVDGFYLLFAKGTLMPGELTRQKLLQIFASSVFGVGFRAAVTEELLYRGLALRALQKGFGRKGAVCASGFLYALAQCEWFPLDGKEWLWTLTVTFITGTSLALVVCETGSIWSAVLIHGLYRIFSGDGRILHIAAEQNVPSVWTYVLETDNRLLAGLPGIDMLYTALPSVLGFLLIGLLAIRWIRKAENTEDVCGKETG